MSDPMLDRLERELLEQVAEIQREYQKMIEPYAKRLAEIQSLRPPPPLIVDTKDLPPDLVRQIQRMAGIEKDL